MSDSFLPHPGEVEHVEKVHPAQDQDDDAKFGRDVFNAFHNIGGLDADPKKEQHKTEVDEVETHQEKVVYRIGHLLIAAKGFDKKESTVLVECARYPDRHPKTDEEIRGVDCKACIHGYLDCYFRLFG